MLYNLIKVLFQKIQNRKKDFFLTYKYDLLQEHYGNNCLDVGSGTGRFGKFLQDEGHKVQCTDIVNKMETNVPFKLFNGVELPNASKSIDTLILFFVLHHTDDQEKLLRDCIRVTQGRIIIGEDIIHNKLDKIMGKIHLGTSPWSKSENGFRTDEEWKKLFEKLGLKLIDELEIPRNIYPVYPISRKIYILEGNNEFYLANDLYENRSSLSL
ncbi:MAG: hypothetical protein CMP48_07715 [Rickettsiales bacterium]|nr:hypothetical protein [Rickettsiales bacterium]